MLISNSSFLFPECYSIIAHCSCFTDPMSSLSSLKIIYFAVFFYPHIYASSKFLCVCFELFHFGGFPQVLVSLMIYSWFTGNSTHWLEAPNASVGPLTLSFIIGWFQWADVGEPTVIVFLGLCAWLVKLSKNESSKLAWRVIVWLLIFWKPSWVFWPKGNVCIQHIIFIVI